MSFILFYNCSYLHISSNLCSDLKIIKIHEVIKHVEVNIECIWYILIIKKLIHLYVL